MKANGYGLYPSKVDRIVKESAEETTKSKSGYSIEANETEEVAEAAD